MEKQQNKNGIRVISICGGIETGLLALQNLGVKVSEYHTFEILPEAIAVSSYHFPKVIHHGDVYDANWEEFMGFDLLLAGTCCQSVSRLRINDPNVCKGLDGKSKIFFEAVKALQIIKPKYFMFENVIPANDEDLRTMNIELGVEGKLINSAIFSAQERERYYWTNFDIPHLPEKSNIVFKDVMEENVLEKYYINKPFSIIDMNKKVCGELHENNLEMHRRIHNPNFKMSTLTCISGGGQFKKVLQNGRVRKLTEVEYERCQGLPDNFTDVKMNGKRLSYSKRCSLCGNGWNLPTVMHILSGIKF